MASWLGLLKSAFPDKTEAVLGNFPKKSQIVMLGLLGAMVAIPPATSTDFNSYAFYGRMIAEYGISPYQHSPRDLAADYWYPRISYFWSDTPSVYGPVFSAIAYAVMTVAGTSVLAARLGFGVVAIAAVLGSVWLASRKIGVGRATVLIGLNPLVLTFGVNDLHCDLLAMVFVIAGAVAVSEHKNVLGAIALAAAALVKISLLPAAAGAFVWLWFQRTRRDAIVLAASVTVAMTVAFAVAGGLSAIDPLLSATSRHTRFSLWTPLYELLTSFDNSFVAQSTADRIISVVSLVSFVTLTLFLWWRYRNDSTPYLVIASGLVAYQLLGAYVLSWYALWSIALLAIVWRRPMFGIVVAHGAWVACAYLSGWLAIPLAPLVIYWLYRVYGAGATNESANRVNSSGSV